MLGLFGSRRRGSSAHRPLSTSTSPAALAAASSVAGSRPPSDGSTTSAAAAVAALRSATTSPEPIGSIQTKRMVRRGSQSSTVSGSVMGGIGRGGSSRPDLQRRGSQSSMTERTFRSPSPGRNNSIRSDPASPAPDVPPVPALPQAVSSSKRSSSLDPPPQRVASPTNTRGNDRAWSMDRGSLPPPTSSRKGNRLSDVSEELERSESNRNGNVNFSRPRSSQPNSPTATGPTTGKQYTHGTGAWFSEPTPQPNGLSSEPKADALTAKLARIQAASGQPTQRSASSQSAQGSYINRAQNRTASGSAFTGPAASSQDMETTMVYDPSTRTFVSKLQPKAKPALPAPTIPQAPALRPGQYDPNTRTIVPVPAAPAPQPTPQPAKRVERPALITDLEPPPRNPARLSPTNIPRTSQLLPTTPSTIHSEPEEFSGAGAGTTVGGFARSAHQRSSSLDVPARGTGSVRGRNISSSPSSQRARFSPSPVIEPTRHDPPPRDVSPAKSAMKHSPAPSLRTHSPLAHFSGAPRSPVSETSDTMSQVSQDGSSKKKKSVRVSFDEQPHEIEASTAAASPKVLGRDRASAIDDLDDEELMKPRPALPSFGSVRKNRVVAEKVTEMAPERNESSSDHAIGGILRNANGAAKPASDPVPPEVTSKETAGYLSDDSDDLGPPAAASTPAQVQISSKEHVAAAEPSPTSPTEPIVRDFAPAPESHQSGAANVPEINLSPPTPGTEEFKQLEAGEQSPRARNSKEIVLPGGWDDESEAEVKSSGAASATATAATIELQPAAEVEPVITQSPEEKSPVLAPIDEDTDTDDDAAFSDAAEDLSDIEGFASIDAIAASPIAPKTSSPVRSSIEPASPSDSPSVQQASKKAESTEATKVQSSSGDWSSATAYWSQLSNAQRQQIEREHFSSDDEARPSPAVAKKVKKTTKHTKDVTQVTPKPPAAKSAPAHRETQPPQPAMKKTMRAQPGPEPAEEPTRMRRSMRDGGGGMAAASLRDRPQSRQSAPPEPQGSLLKKSMRPTSSGGLSSSSAGAAMIQQRDDQKRASRNSAYPKIQPRSQPPVVSSRLQKELQQDSDSESSFKKKRRPSASTVDSTNRYAMKRSMRGGPVEAGPAAREERPISPTLARGRGKDSFSIRSLSPTGSLFGRKTTKELKDSLRNGSVDAGTRTTLRNSRPSKAPARQPPSQSRFKSRFADSDDSDDDAPPSRGFFKSRFVDSDDEDETPIKLVPVRGIPRRKGQEDGDSTDLEDSDDGGRKASRGRTKQTVPLVPDPADVEKATEPARKKLGVSSSNAPPQPAQDTNQGSVLAAGSLRKQPEEVPEPKSIPANVGLTPEKKRRGFMGSILRRNRSSVQSVVTVSSFAPADAPPTPTVPSKSAAGASSPSLPVAQTARPQSPTSPGKLVRRSSNQPPRMKRGDSTYSTATAPPMIGESSTENWPLPPVPKIPENADALGQDGRPNTSDGTPVEAGGHSVRFSEADSQDPRHVYSKRTGKKKKFGMLRRAFKLDD